MKDLVAPGHTFRGRVLRAIIKKKVSTRNRISYSKWVDFNEKDLFIEDHDKHPNAPLISIIVPCYNTPLKYIEPLVSSVLGQAYSNWELCLADGSTDKAATTRISGLSVQDNRIKHLILKQNKGIAGNTNEGLKCANGEFVAFLDHDDTLSPFALSEVVMALNERPETDLFYSDEDKLSDDGKQRSQPFFKPDWSPELLLGVNYITHFVVARKALVDKISGLRAGFDGAQDYDFLLRFTEHTNNIVHIPKILYHWRLATGSTAVTPGEKNYADSAGRQALTDAAKRRNIKARVLEIPEQPTNYRLRYILPKATPKVSIIIPFKDKADLLKQCVSSIFSKTTYKNYELILVSNNSIEPDTHKLLDVLRANKRCKVFLWDNPFNYSAVNNFGRSKASGSILVLLNNDTEVITPNWLEELVGVVLQPGIGAVGPMLRYPNRQIQHAGIVLGLGGMAGHVFRNHNPLDWTEFGMPCWPRNYLAVTGACLVIKTNQYDEMGGLDETFTIAGNDVAFGIKLYEAGYRNVYWPFAELLHHENVSVGSYNNVPQKDYDHSLNYYKPYFNWKDPYFNQNLDLMNEQIGIRSVYG